MKYVSYLLVLSSQLSFAGEVVSLFGRNCVETLNQVPAHRPPTSADVVSAVLTEHDQETPRPEREQHFGLLMADYWEIFRAPEQDDSERASRSHLLSDPQFDLVKFDADQTHVRMRWVNGGITRGFSQSLSVPLLFSRLGESFSMTTIDRLSLRDARLLLNEHRTSVMSFFDRSGRRLRHVQRDAALELRSSGPSVESFPLHNRRLVVEYRQLGPDTLEHLRGTADLITDAGGLLATENAEGVISLYHAILKSGGYLMLWLPFEDAIVAQMLKGLGPEAERNEEHAIGDLAAALPGFELVNTFRTGPIRVAGDRFSRSSHAQVRSGRTIILRKADGRR